MGVFVIDSCGKGKAKWGTEKLITFTDPQLCVCLLPDQFPFPTKSEGKIGMEWSNSDYKIIFTLRCIYNYYWSFFSI